MKLFRHFCTITRHRLIVMRYCFKCGLYRQGLCHDLSKYTPVELFNCGKYYQGTYSPITNERRDKGYSDAWLHHKGRNKHHSEYWIDLSLESGKYEPIPMPKRYVAESVCDRIAASYIYNLGNYNVKMPLEYLYRTKEKTPMHENTFKDLEALLKMYADEGEKALFKYIRRVYLKAEKRERN